VDTIIVQPPGACGRDELLHLGPGDCLRFGRGVPGGGVGLVLRHESVSRVAGEVAATEDHWTLSNFSQDKTYVVENPEGAGEHLKVAPRRVGAPVPFEIARVVLPAGVDVISFQVFAPRHTYLDQVAGPPLPGEPTTAAFPLDLTSKYFLVLVALCEPRLRDQSHVAIPTVDQVVERLRPLPACRQLTPSAVNFHIDYLARDKLRVKQRSLDERSPRLETKRAALVSLALRFDLVREEHLALLPSRLAARVSGADPRGRPGA
jgi:hypothetical protein